MPDSPTVLIVDDHPDALEVLRSFLEDKGYRVRTAPDGPQGLEAAQAEPPDCILLDIMMPAMSGFQVCRQLKSLPHCEHVPVIILTARKVDRDISYARTVGADDFLTKPVRPGQLVAALEKHIGGQGAPAGQFAREQLLAVTTDPALRRVLAKAVDGYNFTRQPDERLDLVDAADGREARDAIRRHRPAAVVLDAKAHNEGADQILRKLKADARHKAIPVLVTRHDAGDDLRFARAEAQLPGRPGGKAILAAVAALFEP